MSDPNNSPDDDGLDALYRRASSHDTSRPTESVRHTILRHAANLATDFAAAARPGDLAVRRPAVARAWRRPVIYGGLAAAALTGLVIVPLVLPPSPPPAAKPPVAAQLAASPATAALDAETTRAPAGSTAQLSAPAAAAAPAPRVTELAPQPLARFAPAHTVPAELRRAAESGDVPRLQALLGAGADVDARDAAGRTALMLAVLNDRSGAADALLASRANPNAVDAAGNTPLQVALAHHEASIAAALRRAGAR